MPSSRETSFLRYDNGEFKEQPEVLVSEISINLWLESMHLASFACSPGDEDALILGHLISSGTILSPDELDGVTQDGSDYYMTLKNTNEFIAKFLANRVETESTPKAVPRAKTALSSVSNESLRSMLSHFQSGQVLHSRTGGAHGALVMDIRSSAMIQVEDIGRHNSVDKAIGLAVRHGLDLTSSTLLLSGRLTAELVEKAAFAGIPVLVSLAVASDMGVQTALNAGITLIGSFRSSSYWIYNEGDVKVSR